MESHAEVYGASRNAVTAPDLTPAEARAEIEAFLGEGFSVWAGPQEDRDGNGFGVFSINVEFATGILCLFSASEVSYRAAVDAIKQAWRDAVRPWVVEAFSEGEAHGIGEMNHKNDVGASEERAAVRIARVLGEDDKP